MEAADEITYWERQRFRQWWLWILVLLIIGFVMWAVVQQIASVLHIGNNPIVRITLIIIAVLFAMGLPLFIYAIRLDVAVTQRSVAILFRPFHWKWVLIDYRTIRSAEICTYSPLKDYGGWGIRYGRNGKAYNVSGDKGVLLTLSDGKSILIGSQNHIALGAAIKARLLSI